MIYWNQLFTQLIHQERPHYWGNWTLSPALDPGAVGILDPQSGEFTVLGLLSQFSLKEEAASADWEIGSSDVSQHEATVALEGTYFDPETGTKINAGVEATWGFKKEKSLVSRFAVKSEKWLNDPGVVIQTGWNKLVTQARANGYGDGTNIEQGFCVVTRAIYADSGLNVGAEQKNSTFSITGSTNGIHGMIQGKGKGSYLYTSQKSGFSCHKWPAEPNQLANQSLPIAYTVASFEGQRIIQNWIQRISSLQLHFNNKHNGTYLAHAKLTYDTQTEKDCKLSADIAGGSIQSKTLPIDATNVRLSVTFTSSSTKCPFKWQDPLAEWSSGERHIDIHGVWPGSPHCSEREG